MGEIIYASQDNPQANSSNVDTIYKYSGTVSELTSESADYFPDFRFRDNTRVMFECSDGIVYPIHVKNNRFFRDTQTDNAFASGGSSDGSAAAFAQDARNYAVSPEDVSFDDSVGNVNQYSSLHYSKKSEDSSVSAAQFEQSAGNYASQSQSSAESSEDSAQRSATSEANANSSSTQAGLHATNSQDAANSSSSSAASSINAKNDAEAARDSAQQSETNAAASEVGAGNEANRAKSEADRAEAAADRAEAAGSGGTVDPALESRVATNEQDIDQLQADLSTANTNIQNNTQAIGDLANASVGQDEVNNAVNSAIENLTSADIYDDDSPYPVGSTNVDGQLSRLRNRQANSFVAGYHTIPANSSVIINLPASYWRGGADCFPIVTKRNANSSGGFYTRRHGLIDLDYAVINTNTFEFYNQSNIELDVRIGFYTT